MTPRRLGDLELVRDIGSERLVPSTDDRYLAFEVGSLTQDLWLLEGF